MELLLCSPKALGGLSVAYERFLHDPQAFENFTPAPQALDRLRGKETSPKWGSYRVEKPAPQPLIVEPTPPPVAEAAEVLVDIQAARTQGRENEQLRIKQILTHPASRGREELAQHFAFESSLPLALVSMALEAAPKGGEAPRTTPTLRQEMRSYQLPQLGPDAGPAPEKMSLQELGAQNAKLLLGKG